MIEDSRFQKDYDPTIRRRIKDAIKQISPLISPVQKALIGDLSRAHLIEVRDYQREQTQSMRSDGLFAEIVMPGETRVYIIATYSHEQQYIFTTVGLQDTNKIELLGLSGDLEYYSGPDAKPETVIFPLLRPLGRELSSEWFSDYP